MVSTKVHTVVDKRNPMVFFNWYKKIARDNENNCFICKGAPSFASKIQRADPTLISGELMLRKLASLLGVAVEDADFDFKDHVTAPVVMAAPAMVAPAMTNFTAPATATEQLYIDKLKLALTHQKGIGKIPSWEAVVKQIQEKVAPACQNAVYLAVQEYYKQTMAPTLNPAPTPSLNFGF